MSLNPVRGVSLPVQSPEQSLVDETWTVLGALVSLELLRPELKQYDSWNRMRSDALNAWDAAEAEAAR